MSLSYRALVVIALPLCVVPACGDSADDAEQGESSESSGSGTSSGTSESSSSADEATTEGEAEADTTEGESGTGEESESSTTGEPEYDCDALFALPLPFEEISGARSAEDYTFDADGYLMSISNGSLFRAAYNQDAEFLFPAVAPGDTSGTGMLPNGDVVFNSTATGEVIRVDSEGLTEVLVGGLAYPNGLQVGDNGWVYVAENGGDQVIRFDPDNPVKEVVVTTGAPNGLAFSADYRRLYIGSFDYGGVKVYDFDTEELTVINSDLSAIDGVVVDVCENVYVTQFGSGDFYRIDPDQQVELVANLPAGWIPNLNFGTGVGGWERDRIYVNVRGDDVVYELAPNIIGIDQPQL